MSAQLQISLGEALRELYGFMSTKRRRELFAVLALMLLAAVAELAALGSVLPFLSLLAGGDAPDHLRWLTELAGVAGRAPGAQQIAAAAMLFMGVAIVAGAVRLLLTWSSLRFTLHFGHDLALGIHRRILHQPYSFHTQRNSSEVLSALEHVQLLVFGVFLPLMSSVAGAIIGTVLVAALVAIDPFTATVAAAAFGLLYLLVSWGGARRLTRNSQVGVEAFNERLKVVQESVGGIRDVIIDDSQQLFLDAFRRADLRLSEARASTSFVAAAPRFIIEAAGMVLFAGVAVVLAQRGGGLAAALPVLGAVALGALRLLPVLQQLYYGWSMLAGNRAVAAQVIEWLRLPLAAEDQDRANLRPLEFNSELRFDDVSFAYRADQRPAVDRVSLTIARGSSVALMGRSGSGKSTLADLLMGLLEPDEGQISVDGVPLTAATRRRWRRSIAHVPQAVFLADASIARNIAFGSREEDIDPVRLREAARIAQLDEVIAGLPEGFATFVGERGIRLSGGQRQRLGIARAIYKDAPVLILDEATSALDEQTEAALLEALTSSGSERRTMLVIAHRRSTIEHCDRVLRIDAGRLTETYRLGAASQESTRRGEA